MAEGDGGSTSGIIIFGLWYVGLLLRFASVGLKCLICDGYSGPATHKKQNVLEQLTDELAVEAPPEPRQVKEVVENRQQPAYEAEPKSVEEDKAVEEDKPEDILPTVAEDVAE